jgi:hypothetical protein
MPEIGICSICKSKTPVYQCSNSECNKLVCMDCSNDYIAPMVEYFFQTSVLPLLKCPSCGKDLIIK